jgi:hypothetical protein
MKCPLLLGMSIACAASCGAQTVEPFPFPPGASSATASAVSGDGRVVFGYARISGQDVVWRWVAGQAPEVLGTPFPGHEVFTVDTNLTGTVLIGNSRLATNPPYPWVWTPESGFVNGIFGGDSGRLKTISENGQHMAGFVGTDTSSVAVRLDIGGAPSALPLMPGRTFVDVYCGSGDGQLLGGVQVGGGTEARPCLWVNEAGDMVPTELPILPQMDFGWLESANCDGSVVVGFCARRNGSFLDAVATRWVNGQVESLGSLQGYRYTRGRDMSDDGRLVMCWTYDGIFWGPAAIWTAETGVITLHQYLTERGVSLQGRTLTELAARISRNGRVIITQDTSGTPLRITLPPVCTGDFNGDGDFGTDQDIEAFFRCHSGLGCPSCRTSDYNGDGDHGTDQDIEAFFSVLAGGGC